MSPIASLSIFRPIRFVRGKPQVSPASESAVRKLAKYINDHPDKGIVSIEGHSSRSGTAKANIYITSRRAQEVRNLLIKYGVPKERLVYSGHGWTRPLVDHKTPASYLKNRRIEMRWVQPNDATFRIRKVSLKKTSAALIFRFKTSRPIQREQVEMNLDGPTVLMVRILGAQVYREWLDLKDPWIKELAASVYSGPARWHLARPTDASLHGYGP